LLTNHNSELLSRFLNSRRQGISPRTIEFYQSCLKPFVKSYDLIPEGINRFLSDLPCGNAKHAYYRAIRAFCNWLYRQGHLKSNLIAKVDAPKPAKQILPSLTREQVEYLIDNADSLRDRAIISLLADSGMRLSELTYITAEDIDWENHTVTIWGKGNKQRKAPFTERTASLIKQWMSHNGAGDTIWHLQNRGIQIMLTRLGQRTGLPCNPHTFRRTFASNLHRSGMDIEHIMRLGGWESLDMVIRYTRSVKFEDSLKHYQALLQ
jgi:site-specific recombinase XerD